MDDPVAAFETVSVCIGKYKQTKSELIQAMSIAQTFLTGNKAIQVSGKKSFGQQSSSVHETKPGDIDLEKLLADEEEDQGQKAGIKRGRPPKGSKAPVTC